MGVDDGRAFCCAGCRTVFELLSENGLGQFYELDGAAGVRMTERLVAGQFDFLDEPAVRARLVEFSDGTTARVSFFLPGIHCIGCVWLLENLFRLSPGLGRSQVHFSRKRITISFNKSTVRLSTVAELLGSLGYWPELNLADLDRPPARPASRRLVMQMGVAGFAFGNTMLLSISAYLGLDSFSGPGFQQLSGWISLCLALPVVAYSAADYWRAAWLSLRHRRLALEVPIAAGIAALFAQSVFEVVSGRGAGYFDSLCGLLFYLLGGKLFQQKTFDRLAFDRDYRSFFPLSVTRLALPSAQGDEKDSVERVESRVALSQLAVGDRLLLRHGELIPADARLAAGVAVIDYSFVTGEAIPVNRSEGDLLYAGGRQVGGVIEVEMVKPVSQSHLTSLWDEGAFAKTREKSFDTLTNQLSPRFTMIIIAIAVGAAIFWSRVDATRAVKSFTSVLIVACPCALALAAPFALGNAQRALARRGVFLRNGVVIEALARVDTLVFDKTGTLTSPGGGRVAFLGSPLADVEQACIRAVAAQSSHPLALRLAAALADGRETISPRPPAVGSFFEIPGCGIEATADGHEIWLGSRMWFEQRGAQDLPGASDSGGATVHVAIDGRHRGVFSLDHGLRAETGPLLRDLGAQYETALLSGDNALERARFARWLGPRAELRFEQSPLDKLRYIESRQKSGRTVMMIGDGLNDAGALRQSDVGVAVVEGIGVFSPASDIIIEASGVPRLAGLLCYARSVVRVVHASFVISSLYNVAGLSIAATGHLSPLVCAILMPLSSVSVVAFACGATAWLARRIGDTSSIVEKIRTREGQRG